MVKVVDVKMTKALRDQPHGEKGRKLTLGNKHLPSGIHEKDCWQKCFIPTFLDWVGQQADPWNLPENKVINVLQKIWNVVYKSIPYTVKQKMLFVQSYIKFLLCIRCLQKLQAQQRARDSGCAVIGSTAIAIAISVLENCEDDISNEDCQAIAQEQLDTDTFLYGDIESEVRTSCILLRVTNYY
jgi:hypothetical protein